MAKIHFSLFFVFLTYSNAKFIVDFISELILSRSGDIYIFPDPGVFVIY